MRPIYVIIALVMALIVWAAYGDLSVGFASYFTEDPSIDLAHAGSWGDSFGAFNALVSMLGAGAVVATLLVQLRAIKAQQHDLHRQRFESSFFELLRLLRELRAEMRFQHSKEYGEAHELDSPSHEYEGYVAISHALAEMLHWQNQSEIELDRQAIGKLYDKHIARLNEHSMSPYFRLVYTILNRIRNDSVLTDGERCQYGNLLRSQLTSFELYMIAYNACSKRSKDLTAHIEYFRLFKYMENSKAKRRFVNIFKPVAFAARS